MADDTLKIRVDVETASLRDLSNEIKRVDNALKDIKPNDPRFVEGAENLQSLRARFGELSKAVIRGNGELHALAGMHKEVQTAITPESDEIRKLIAIMQSEHSTAAQVSSAQKDLTQVYRENATVLDISQGKWKEVSTAISKGRDVTNDANAQLYSANARLKESYFTLGEQLRRQAVDNGGYVSSLQVTKIAEDLAAKGNIELQESLALVNTQLHNNGITVSDQAVHLNQMTQEIRKMAASSGGYITELQMQRIAQDLVAKSGIEMKAALAQVNSQLVANNVRIAETNVSVTSLGESFKDLTGKIFAAYAAYQSVKFLSNAAEEAARVQLLSEELDRLGKQKGFDATELIKQMGEASGGTVKQIDALQIALRAIQLGNIDLSKLPAVMEKLDYQSKLLGVDTRELFDQFIRGAETGSKKFQVQFGLLYDTKKAEEDYAKSIGTTVENLSEEEKAAVRVRIAIEELSKRQVDNNSQAVKTLESYERASVAFDDAKRAIGELIASPLGKFLASAALEAAIAAEGISALFKVTAAYVVFMNTHNFALAKAVLMSAGEEGNAIKKQVEEIGRLWTGQKTAQDNLLFTENMFYARRKRELDEWEQSTLDKSNKEIKTEEQRNATIIQIHAERELIEKQHVERLKQLQGAAIGSGVSPIEHTASAEELKKSEKDVATFIKDTTKVLYDQKLQIITSATEKARLENLKFHTDRINELKDDLVQLPEIERSLQSALKAERSKADPDKDKINQLERQREQLPTRKAINDAIISENDRFAKKDIAIGEDHGRQMYVNELEVRKIVAEVTHNATEQKKAEAEIAFQAELDTLNKALIEYPEKQKEIEAAIQAVKKARAEAPEKLAQESQKAENDAIVEIHRMRAQSIAEISKNESEMLRMEEQDRHDQVIARLNELKSEQPQLQTEIDLALEAEAERHVKAMENIQEGEDFTKYHELVEVLNSGFNSANGAASEFFQRFAENNFHAMNIFQRFVLGVLQGLEQIIEKLVAMAIIKTVLNAVTGGSAIPGTEIGSATAFAAEGMVIDETIIGRGVRSGTQYVFGEAGREVIAPLTGPGTLVDRIGGILPSGESRNFIAETMEKVSSVYGGSQVSYADRSPLSSIQERFTNRDILNGSLADRFQALSQIIMPEVASPAASPGGHDRLSSLMPSSMPHDPVKVDLSGQFSLGYRELVMSVKEAVILDIKRGGRGIS